MLKLLLKRPYFSHVLENTCYDIINSIDEISSSSFAWPALESILSAVEQIPETLHAKSWPPQSERIASFQCEITSLSPCTIRIEKQKYTMYVYLYRTLVFSLNILTWI